MERFEAVEMEIIEFGAEDDSITNSDTLTPELPIGQDNE